MYPVERATRRVMLFGAVLAIGTAVTAGAFAAADTRGQAATPQASIRIGLVLPDLSNLYIAGIRDGAVAQGKKSGARSSSRARTTPPGRRTRCSPTSARRSTRSSSTRSTAPRSCPAVKAANKAGIPVVAIQSNVNGGKIATFIAGRETVAGAAMGEGRRQLLQGQEPVQDRHRRGHPAPTSRAREENKAFRANVDKLPEHQDRRRRPRRSTTRRRRSTSRPTC